jgi:succinate dehydrogenase / fumarate reductase membrane anchor subunit
MASPYVSSRSGRFAWMMQRVTAALLVPLAFVHFGMQHFTSDAVSTGLATTFRLHNPFWVAYYVIFVTCVLYHGVNGVMGIVSDYAPKKLNRAIIALVLWTLALFFGVLGVKNLVAPAHNLESAKVWYTQNGFPDGESAGNPPNILWAPRYEFATDEVRELNMLYYYLTKHTSLDKEQKDAAKTIFGDAGKDVTKGGELFDAWCLAQLEAGNKRPDERGRYKIFSSSYEFALWALNVRKTDAEKRRIVAEERDDADLVAQADVVLARLAAVPTYDPASN